jgi:FAD/FMN-containing dehydrogenase
MDPEQPVAGVADGMMLDELTPDAVTTVTDLVTPDSPLVSVEFRHLGGALRRTPPGAGVIGALDAAYLMTAVGPAPTPEAADAVERDLAMLQRALARWDSGRMNANFASQPRSGRSLFGEDGYMRLRRLKSEIDPDNLFHANHQIEPAEPRRARDGKPRQKVDVQRRAA